MTLDKAIGVLADLLGEGPYYDPELRREAVKLGIEALRRLQDMRKGSRNQRAFATSLLLPGETEEGKA